jgi:tRNA (guanine37-N1)-methyltransferase
MLRVGFVTLFPEMVLGAVSHSILARASAACAVEFRAANPRDFAQDKHRSVDDTSYGGGPGMVLMAPLVAAALESLGPRPGTCVVLCDPTGERFDQSAAKGLSRRESLVFLCGHYEGVDERVRTKLATHVYSVGDFVLTGGELPALAMADAVVRLLPGVIGDPQSHEDDSFEGGLLGFPLYTRPETFLGEPVPDVLRSGDHAAIARWRRSQQLRRTRASRPDLFCRAPLAPSDLALLDPQNPDPRP